MLMRIGRSAVLSGNSDHNRTQLVMRTGVIVKVKPAESC